MEINLDTRIFIAVTICSFSEYVNASRMKLDDDVTIIKQFLFETSGYCSRSNGGDDIMRIISSKLIVPVDWGVGRIERPESFWAGR